MARKFGASHVTGITMPASLETMLQLVAATNWLVAVNGYGIGGRGTSNTDTPGFIEVIPQTSAGTGSAGDVVKKGTYAEALQTTSIDTFTAEPTDGGDATRIRAHTVHPQAALDIRDAYTQEIMIGTAGRLGFRGTFGQAQTVDFYVDFEE